MNREREILAVFRAEPKNTTLTAAQILKRCPDWNPQTPLESVRKTLARMGRLEVAQPAGNGLAERWRVKPAGQPVGSTGPR